ncbi:MAG: hypothetical protein RLZZ383_2223 [Pseudomonadota bacterium]|jgi:hypothetical protein
MKRSFRLVALVAVTGCGEPAPTFSGEIAPIFARNCTTAGCHAPPVEAGLDLSPGLAWSQLVDVPSTQAPSVLRVVPGDAEASYLYRKLASTHIEAGGSGTLMPPGFGLANNEVAIVAAWIEAGALDD